MTQQEPPNDPQRDAVFSEAIDALRTPVPIRASAREALAAALSAERPRVAQPDPQATVRARVGHRRSHWLTAPLRVPVSPLSLLAAASALVVATALVTKQITVAPQARANAQASRDAQVVRFTLAAPTARQVSLVGDFNGWNPAATALTQRNGVWSVVIPVAPGRHQYGFVVDDSTWIADPSAVQSADADFGSPNSVVYVGS